MIVLQAPQSIADSDRSLVPILWLGILVSVFLIQFLWWRRRRAAMKALAARRGLEWSTGELPSSFPTELLANLGSFWTWGGRYTKIYDVVSGYDGGDRLLAFDMRVGSGRSSYRQTVVAVRSGSPRGVPLWGGRDVYREKDGWRVLIPKKLFGVSGVLSVKSIEELWSALR